MTVAGKIYESFVGKFPPAQEGHLRIWWIPQIPGKGFEWAIPDLKTASLMLDVLAAYDDFQFAENVKGDYCNMGGLQVFQDGEWVDWEDDDGNDFDEYRRSDAFIEAAP